MHQHQDAVLEGQSASTLSFSFLAPLGFVGSLLALAGAIVSGFGSRWGWWHFPIGFDILRWAAYTGLAAAAVSLIGGVAVRSGSIRRGFILASAGIVIGLVVAAVPWSWQQRARELPKIHDITTDTINPPGFKAILLLRKRAPNMARYGGARVASLQRSAYPHIKPLMVMAPPSTTFKRALAAARQLGWMVVDANAAEGRIEATAATFWFGFKDDVIVRISRVAGGSRVDVRSVSRVGAGDAGTNAARIRDYLNEFITSR